MMAELAARADDLRLDLFGGFRMTAGGRPVPISSRRARALIGFLRLARDGSASRERLAGLLWSDRGEEQARASLRQCLLEIRAALTPFAVELIQAGRDSIGLNAGGPASDVSELEHVIAAKDPVALAGALENLADRELLADAGVGGLLIGRASCRERVSSVV